MNYTICLDPASVNFNLSSLSPNGFSVYSDADGFTVPLATGIPLSALFPPPTGNCPYVITGIPNNATQLLIIDQCVVGANQIPAIFKTIATPEEPPTIDCCYALINLESCSDWCSECTLGFDIFDSSTVGRIIAGTLSSTCGTVTDYTIGWYLNGDYSAPAIITGFGSTFTGYQFTHPLTLAAGTAPMVAAGNYEGIIHDIIINGTTYSSVSGSANGTNIPFKSCFDTVVASPFTCANGDFPLPYTHQISLTAAGNGAPVPPISATYELDPTTDYFAYEFTGYNIYDNLVIKFISGDPALTNNPTLYSDPIYFENADIGGNNNWQGNTIIASSSLVNQVYPKIILSNSAFKRVLSLTNIERTPGDRLDITVTPNPNNPQTSWVLKMQCLDTFDCDICTWDNSPPLKISSIDLDRVPSSSNDCLLQRITLNASGCSAQITNDLIEYIQYSAPAAPINNVQIPSPWLSLDGGIGCYINNQEGGNHQCDIPSTGSITFSKTNNPSNGFSSTGVPLGQIYMTFTEYVDYIHYKNQLIDTENTLQATIGSITYDCTNYRYYSGYALKFPVSTNPNSICGDPIVVKKYRIHRTAYPNIQYVEDFVNNFYSITIPMPEVLDCLTFPGCTDCYDGSHSYGGGGGNNPDAYTALRIFNSSSFLDLSNIYSQTNNKSSKFTDPWGYMYFYTGSSNSPSFFSSSIYSFPSYVSAYSIKTLPFVPSAGSPTGWVDLHSLGSELCSSSIHSTLQQNANLGDAFGFGFIGYYYAPSIVFPNLINVGSDPRNDDFHIFASVLDNSGTIQPAELIYSYSSSIITVYQPQHFVGGNPPLTVDSF